MKDASTSFDSILKENEKLKKKIELLDFKLISNKLLFNAAGSINLLIDPDTGRICDANITALNFYGYPLEVLTTMTIYDINTLSLKEIKNKIDLLIKQKNKKYEFNHRVANGDIKNVEVNSSIIEINDSKYLYSIIVDVTQSKKLENRLTINEQRFIELTNQSKTVIWEVDTNGLYTYVSPVCKEVWGLEDHQIVFKKHFYDLHPEEGREEFKKAAFKVFEQKKSFENLINCIENINHKLTWVSTNGIPLLDQDQNLLGYRGADIDITERRKIEMENLELQYTLEKKVEDRTLELEKINLLLLKEIEERKSIETLLIQSEKKYRTVVENVNEVIFQTDKAGYWLFLNNAWETITGFAIEESMKQLFLNYVHPDDRARNWELFEPLMLRKKIFCRHEIRYLTKDGGFRWMEVFAKIAINDNDEFTGTYGSLSDIHDRKLTEIKLLESKKRFKNILEQSTEAIGIHENGIWTFCNLAALNLFGFSNFEELIGKSILNVISENEKERIIDFVNKRKSNETAPDLYITTGLRKDKTEFDLEVSITKLEFDKNIEVLSLMRDISEKQKISKELLMSSKLSEEANKAKSEFLSRMSHELRTPLNSILGFAQLLEMSDLNPSQIKGVNHIKNSGKHLLNLINDVLDISKIEAGKLTISIESIEVEKTIKEITNLLLPQIVEANLFLEIQKSSTDTLYVKSDLTLFKQIIINLLSNAIKYNVTGGSIIIKTDIIIGSSVEQTKIRISVIDNGIGIAEEDISKLFKSFERIGAGKTKAEGTGLGLSVVKKLIDTLGGNIGVESKLGFGSTFWFELPWADKALEMEFSQEALGKLIQNDFNNGTILYIEDNQSNIELIEQIIATKRPNIHLVTNLNGKDATALAKKLKPNLILLDLNLPDLHGSEVIKLLKSEQDINKIPVVIISADALPNQINELMSLGASHFLTKPIDVKDFLKTIDTFLNL